MTGEERASVQVVDDDEGMVATLEDLIAAIRGAVERRASGGGTPQR